MSDLPAKSKVSLKRLRNCTPTIVNEGAPREEKTITGTSLVLKSPNATVLATALRPLPWYLSLIHI